VQAAEFKQNRSLFDQKARQQTKKLLEKEKVELVTGEDDETDEHLAGNDTGSKTTDPSKSTSLKRTATEDEQGESEAGGRRAGGSLSLSLQPKAQKQRIE